jgi:threonine aldolase
MMRSRKVALLSSVRACAAQQQRWFSSRMTVVDLRSDTVTQPSKDMLAFGMAAQTGDDVFGEDPSISQLQATLASKFNKEAALYCPTGTMANLVAIMAHCHGRASEIVIGTQSHLCLWEGGNVSNIGGVSTRQVPELENGQLPLDQVRDVWTSDNDDHWAKTQLVCLENSQNMMGGVALPKSYIDNVGSTCRDLNVKLHIDGARIFNAAVCLEEDVKDLCAAADTVSICLSKGLGAPLGSVLVGDTETIRLAKRARKRLGGGMRQAGVVAAMGLYAIEHNVERLAQDHTRARRMAAELKAHGFQIPRDGKVDTNIVYFSLPENSLVTKDLLGPRLLAEYGVKVGAGYRGGMLFRVCTHLDVNDEDLDRATEAIIKLCVTG